MHAMRLAIQDEAQNNHCARDQRLQKFQTECSVQGYQINEARVCKISILNENASLPDFAAGDVLFSRSFCVGPATVNTARDIYFDNDKVFENPETGLKFSLSVDAKWGWKETGFVWQADPAKRSSSIGMSVNNYNSEYSYDSILSFKYSNFSDEEINHVEWTPDGRNLIAIQCSRAPSCDNFPLTVGTQKTVLKVGEYAYSEITHRVGLVKEVHEDGTVGLDYGKQTNPAGEIRIERSEKLSREVDEMNGIGAGMEVRANALYGDSTVVRVFRNGLAQLDYGAGPEIYTIAPTSVLIPR